MPIQRMTYFKVKDEADIQPMMEQYGVLERTQQKVSK